MIALASVIALIGPPTEITLTVNGEQREAIIIAPTKKTANPPVIFGYHGHGGKAANCVRYFDLQSSWPEAVVVYPNGTPTKTPKDPAGTRNGWDAFTQKNNRDLDFFDALLARVKKDYSIDPKRVFVMGHSNGGSFTYFLWQVRADVITAVGPCAAAGARRVTTPRPAFIMKGEKDPIVNPRLQQASIDAALKLNKVQAEPKKISDIVTSYAGPNPVVTYIHPGGHGFEKKAVPYMIQFFKGLPKPL
jgi:polyhydroxybutyrate depolymerase